MLVFILFSLVVGAQCDELRAKAQTLLENLFSTRDASNILPNFNVNFHFDFNKAQLNKDAFIEKYLLASKTKPVLGDVTLVRRDEYKLGIENGMSLPGVESVTREYVYMVWSWTEFGGNMTFDALEFGNSLMIYNGTMTA